MLALVAALIYSVATNDNLQWSEVREFLFESSVLDGLWVTIQLTVLAMVAGIALGIVLAVMRLSQNPVLRTVGWFYIWLFRGTPVLVQLLIWFNLALFFPRIGFGSFSADTNDLVKPFVAALLALALNEAAYMAEVVRGGILAVDPGQNEASAALGMTQGQTMRRIVLPQAMRVIIPPTGNETITMLKTTSLVLVVGAGDLLTKTSAIAAKNFTTMEMLFVASFWYLVLTSILSYGQSHLERRFARGAAGALPPTLGQRILANLRPGRVVGRVAMTTQMVKAENIHKSFGHVDVLKGIDLEVAPEEVFCLVGPSGSGKSTLPALHQPPGEGRRRQLYVDGQLVGYRQRGDKLHELREKEVAAHRRDIGMVFQRFNLFAHMTALQNVMEAPLRVRRESEGSRPGACRQAARPRRPRRQGRAAIRPSSPAASSSASRSPGRWPWSPS